MIANGKLKWDLVRTEDEADWPLTRIPFPLWKVSEDDNAVVLTLIKAKEMPLLTRILSRFEEGTWSRQRSPLQMMAAGFGVKTTV
jgi:hypothetical protein